ARAALEAAMAADPGLAQRVARHQALRARLRAALDPVLDEPLPQRLLESVRGAAAPRPAAKVIPLKRPAAPRWSWPQLGALAAAARRRRLPAGSDGAAAERRAHAR